MTIELCDRCQKQLFHKEEIGHTVNVYKRHTMLRHTVLCSECLGAYGDAFNAFMKHPKESIIEVDWRSSRDDEEIA